MKVLLVACAVVLAVYANVVPEERVQVVEGVDLSGAEPREAPPIEVAARAGGEEAAGYAAGAEGSPVQLGMNLDYLAENGLLVPILSRSCTNAACARICNLLGFSNGVCISSDTCQCS